jgi:hypothetical protein
MKALLFLNALIGVLATPRTIIECRPTDIKSIIGGEDYTVDEIRGVHFVHLKRE